MAKSTSFIRCATYYQMFFWGIKAASAYHQTVVQVKYETMRYEKMKK